MKYLMTSKNFSVLTFVIFSIIFNGCVDKEKRAAELLREAERNLYNSRIEQARKLFLEATELDPANAQGWYGLGLTWMNEEKWEIAIGYFDKAIQLKSDFTDAFYNRGQANFYLGEVYRACDDWRVAYELGKPNMEDKLRKCE